MLTFVALNAGAVGAALLTAKAARATQPTSRLLLTALSAYLIAIYSVTLLAGLAGRLTPAGLVVGMAGAVALAGWLARRARAPEGHDGRPRFGAAGLAAVLVATAAGGVWAWPHLVDATRLWVWDDYTYHMVYPALWLREQAIAAPAPAQAFTMQAWYPLGASVVAAWFMAPLYATRADALAWVSLTGPIYGGLVIAGAAEVLARLGCRAGTWAVPLILFATSHRVGIMANGFSDADLAQAAALFGAFAFAVPRSATDADVGADAWCAALLTGFALAVKVSAAPIALVILAMVAARAVASGGVRCAGRTGLVFALAWTLMAGYWYGRNIVHTGNPVYPAAGLFWTGTTFPETTLLEYSRHYGLRRAVADALSVYMNWPVLHAVLSVVGLIGLAAWLARRRRALTGPTRAFGLGALAITTVVLVLLPATPYSAGNAMTFRSGFVHWDSMRYVALLPFLGWVALGFLLDALGRALPQGSTMPIVTVGGASPGASRPTSVALGVGASGPRRFVALLITLLVVGALIVGWHGRKAAATAASVIGEPLFGSAAAVLDDQPAGTRVAIFGDQWIYPAFGARHHLRPVRLDGNGRVAGAPIGDAMGPGDLGVDPATFRSNLRAAGIGVVVVVHQPHPGRSPAWPAQHHALEAAGDARLLHRDRAVAVWSLGR
jgi:hypothetical protein